MGSYRIGGLAVALGIGSAVVAGHGVASADTSGESGSESSSSGSSRRKGPRRPNRRQGSLLPSRHRRKATTQAHRTKPRIDDRNNRDARWSGGRRDAVRRRLANAHEAVKQAAPVLCGRRLAHAGPCGCLWQCVGRGARKACAESRYTGQSRSGHRRCANTCRRRARDNDHDGEPTGRAGATVSRRMRSRWRRLLCRKR